jgi:hypothetical protein
VKLTLVGVPFEGRLDSNGGEINGRFAAGKQSIPAEFHRSGATVLPSYAATNQNDVAGHWAAVWNSSQGQIHLRLHLGRLPGGKLVATLDSPDEGLTGATATLIHRSRETYLGIRWAAFGYSFEGHLSANQFSGAWRGRGESVPLVFEKAATTP